MTTALEAPRRRSRAGRVIARLASDPRRPGYETYWSSIAPRSDADFFRRWLFAYASVQTSWQRNVLIYEALAAPGVDFSEAELRQVLKACGAGLTNNRAIGLARLHRDYWSDPARFRVRPGESFAACRDRLVPLVHGLGIAKVAFVLELCYPRECDVACLDRHLLRLCGLDVESIRDRDYRRAEANWARHCRRFDVPCPIARHLYWDEVQGQTSTRYWSCVFEQERVNQIWPEVRLITENATCST